jgi:aryl-alcohol dehydrogenase-like predicted oxidoreductase
MNDVPVSMCRTADVRDVNISRVGLGCASAWGQSWFNESEAIAIVRRAIELGVTVFDTGPSYSNGNAEPRLAKALRGVDVDKLLISTKVGTHIGINGKSYHDLTPKAVLDSVEASRRKMNLDSVPLLYLHGPRKDELENRLLDTLQEMRERGWVRRLGVNSFDTGVLERLAEIPQFDVVMLDYNVLRSTREPLIARLSKYGKCIVAGAAVANHLYSPGFILPKSKADVWYLLRAVKNYRGDLLRARKLRLTVEGCDEWTPAQIALAFVLHNEQIATAMFSTTRLNHLEENIAAVDVDLPDTLVRKIRSL